MIHLIKKIKPEPVNIIDIPYARMMVDQRLASEIGELLFKHYPGHIWYVHVDSRPTVGIVKIYNGIISVSHSYNLHIDTVYNDPQRKCIIRAGGELLERGNIKRAQWNGDLTDYVEGLPDKYQPGKGFVR